MGDFWDDIMLDGRMMFQVANGSVIALEYYYGEDC